MKLPINDKYQISTDANNWKIDKKVNKVRKVKGKPDQLIEWESIKFYNTLAGCVNGLAERMLMDSDCQTLAEALEFNKNTLTLLTQALSPEYTVNSRL